MHKQKEFLTPPVISLVHVEYEGIMQPAWSESKQKQQLGSRKICLLSASLIDSYPDLADNVGEVSHWPLRELEEGPLKTHYWSLRRLLHFNGTSVKYCLNFSVHYFAL